MNTFTAICRRIKIWWKTPCYYIIANGMPPVYEGEEELQELLTDLKKQTDKNNMNMNKKTLITTLLVLVAMAGQTQEIKMNEATINDYIPMLNQKGYQAYSFDVSAIKGQTLSVLLDLV